MADPRNTLLYLLYTCIFSDNGDTKNVCSVKLTMWNLKDIIEAGRGRWRIKNEGFRWKIENGFNQQKNGIYDIQHLNSRNSNAMKNHYPCHSDIRSDHTSLSGMEPSIKEIGQSIKNT